MISEHHFALCVCVCTWLHACHSMWKVGKARSWFSLSTNYIYIFQGKNSVFRFGGKCLCPLNHFAIPTVCFELCFWELTSFYMSEDDDTPLSMKTQATYYFHSSRETPIIGYSCLHC